MRYFYLTPMLSGPGAARYPITEVVQMIGRSERADIALLEPTVSRQHATVQHLAGQVVLKDLGSKHGTFVNSRRVSSASLKAGDIVVFGLSLVLRLESAEQPLPPVDAEHTSAGQEFIADDLAVTAIRTVTIPPRPARSSGPAEEVEDIGRIQNQMAKVHKLAAAGAACVQQLPDLNSQLASLRGELLPWGAAQPELARLLERLDEVLAAMGRLNQVLGLLPRRRMEPTSLAEVVKEAVETVLADAGARGIKIVSEVGGDFVVAAESRRLVHAATELIRNAIRQSPEQGTIKVVAARRGREVTLSVSDRGQGFPPELLETACDPFVTRSGDWEALGLGLFEARQIVMACGGSLQVESRPGAGATVRLHFPGGT